MQKIDSYFGNLTPHFSIYSFSSVVRDKKQEPVPGKFQDTSN
jgi:hypothetical protein